VRALLKPHGEEARSHRSLDAGKLAAHTTKPTLIALLSSLLQRPPRRPAVYDRGACAGRYRAPVVAAAAGRRSGSACSADGALRRRRPPRRRRCSPGRGGCQGESGEGCHAASGVGWAGAMPGCRAGNSGRAALGRHWRPAWEGLEKGCCMRCRLLPGARSRCLLLMDGQLEGVMQELMNGRFVVWWSSLAGVSRWQVQYNEICDKIR
jgi:hypothetical protein